METLSPSGVFPKGRSLIVCFKLPPEQLAHKKIKEKNSEISKFDM
jgi:hypothetical protein